MRTRRGCQTRLNLNFWIARDSLTTLQRLRSLSFRYWRSNHRYRSASHIGSVQCCSSSGLDLPRRTSRDESSDNASSGNDVAYITTSAGSRAELALLSRFIDICLPAHRDIGAGSTLSLSCGNATLRVICRASRSTQIFSARSL